MNAEQWPGAERRRCCLHCVLFLLSDTLERTFSFFVAGLLLKKEPALV
jgi:hypothetical protein